MVKNILITGGTGFIGSNLIYSLKNNYEFINLGRSENKLCKNIYWDLKESLDDKIDTRIEAVIHSASIVGNGSSNKSDYIDINVKSTLELLEFCLKNNVKKFIYISTGGVYGYSEKELSENSECNPIDMYSLSKYFSERLCDLYKDKISIVILRMFFPYGNGQHGRLINNLLNSILQGKEINLNKNGLPMINPIHITDVVNMLKIVLETDCSGAFNICGDENISIEDLCKKIACYSNSSSPNFVHSNNSVSNLMGSNKKICNLLNYKMKINLDTGIKLLLNS